MERMSDYKKEFDLACEKIVRLEEENKKLKEFKTKREESMFYFKALAERVEPINSKEAEELQKYKKLFEKLYREELSGLQRENDKLKIHIEAKDKAYMDLLADYNYLKARIKKTERAFLKYEEKQEKLLGDLDMIVMNR